MASSCVRGSLEWILEKNSSQKELSSIGSDCPGKWFHPSHHPWKCSKDVVLAAEAMVLWRTLWWRLWIVRLADHRGLYQPQCCEINFFSGRASVQTEAGIELSIPHSLQVVYLIDYMQKTKVCTAALSNNESFFPQDVWVLCTFNYV